MHSKMISFLLVATALPVALAGCSSPSASSVGEHAKPNDLKDLTSGRHLLVEYQPNGQSNSWVDSDSHTLEAAVIQIGNDQMQECYVSAKNTTPHDCWPSVTISSTASVHTKCYGGGYNLGTPQERDISLCVSDRPVKGEDVQDQDNGFYKMTIPAGVPYIQIQDGTSYASTTKNYRFKVAANVDSTVPPSPPADGKGGM